MKTGEATVENSMEVTHKTKNKPPYDIAIPSLDIYLKKAKNTNSRRYTHTLFVACYLHLPKQRSYLCPSTKEQTKKKKREWAQVNEIRNENGEVTNGYHKNTKDHKRLHQ